MSNEVHKEIIKASFHAINDLRYQMKELLTSTDEEEPEVVTALIAQRWAFEVQFLHSAMAPIQKNRRQGLDYSLAGILEKDYSAARDFVRGIDEGAALLAKLDKIYGEPI